MYDVALYGHLTLDRIFTNFSKDFSIGSIGNVWKHLNNLDPSLKIYIEPTDIGEALILVNEEKNERSSIANLSLFNKEPTLKDSTWSHVLYLNELKDASYINNIKSDIVSVDVCRGQKIKNLEILSKVDFLFISDEDEFENLQEASRLLKKGLILHDPAGSVYYDNKGNKQRFNTKFVDNVNVLGCGDMLAAAYIKFYLESKNVAISLKKAHESVYNVLQRKKEVLHGES